MAATALPPTGGEPSGDEPVVCDARGMAQIHRWFRADFAEAPLLVDAVVPGDTERARVVARHLRTLSIGLHAHHEGEDERLWSTLTERSPGCAVHVERMQAQHGEMLEHLTSLDLALPPWEAGATHPAAVLAALDGVNAALAVHLPDEEETIVPVIERTMTDAELAWFGKHGNAAVPQGQMWQVLGAILAAQPDGGDEFLRHELPAPARLMWRLVGQRAYAKHRAALTGT